MMVNMVRARSSLGVPVMVPSSVLKARPFGRLGLIDQETTAPDPVTVGASGKSLLAVLLIICRSSGVYVMTGATSLTSRVNVAVVLPPALVAVTVYVVDGETAVGVPLISPVVVLKARPAGRVGEIDHVATGPPLAVGVTGVMVVPFSSVSELGVKATPDGAATMTSIVTVVVALPPEFAAVTVYTADELRTVGVPEMAPVELSKARPAGSDGVTDQSITAPPLDVGVTVVMAESLVSESVLGL